MGVRDYVAVLNRRKLAVLLTCGLVVGSALAFSYSQTRVYEARTRLLMGSSQSSVDLQGGGQYIDPNRIQTEIQVLVGKQIRDLVQAQMGPVPEVAAAAVGTTAVVELTSRSTRPSVAADVANGYADAYIKYRRQQFLDSVSAATREYTRQILELQKQIDAIDARPRPPGVPATASNPELDNVRAQQSAFQIKLQQLDAQQNLAGNAAAVIAPAVPPTTPVRPTPRRDLLLGLLVGLMLGVGAAFLLEHLDDSIKTKEDVEAAVPALSVVGVLPVVAGWKNKEEPMVVALTDPTSPAAEAYRTLRTSVQFMGLDRSLRILQVTSAVASEGKTTTLANLAVVLSQAGMRVLIVGCDLRRPRIHGFFGLSNEVGFTSVILGQVPLASAVQRVPGLSRLNLLASGPLPPNPSELLSSVRTVDLFAQLRANSDIVLVDSPPVLPVTDAAVLATRVDGTLLVAAAKFTVTKNLVRTAELLSQIDANVLGVALNRASGAGGYDSRYRYYTAAPEDTRRGQRKAGKGVPQATRKVS